MEFGDRYELDPTAAAEHAAWLLQLCSDIRVGKVVHASQIPIDKQEAAWVHLRDCGGHADQDLRGLDDSLAVMLDD